MTKRKGEPAPIINRVPLGKLTIFEITEAELEALERGSPESSHFNLGIASLSVACSFLVALLTTTIDNLKTFCVFVIVTAVGLLGGVAFSILWWRSRGSIKNVAREIRSRQSPLESIQGYDDSAGQGGQAGMQAPPPPLE